MKVTRRCGLRLRDNYSREVSLPTPAVQQSCLAFSVVVEPNPFLITFFLQAFPLAEGRLHRQ